MLNDTGDVMGARATASTRATPSAHDAFQIFKQYYDDQHSHESFLVMFLKEDGRHICTEIFSRGGRAESFVDVNAIVKRARQKAAASIYVAHNHPSNRLWPSKSDDEVTAALDTYCGRAGIKMHDHLILAREDFYSSRARRNSIDDPGLKRQRVEQPPALPQGVPQGVPQGLPAPMQPRAPMQPAPMQPAPMQPAPSSLPPCSLLPCSLPPCSLPTCSLPTCSQRACRPASGSCRGRASRRIPPRSSPCASSSRRPSTCPSRSP